MIFAYLAIAVLVLAALILTGERPEGGFVTTHRDVYLAYRSDGSLVGHYGTEDEAVEALRGAA